MSDQVTAKLLEAGFTQAELDAPADNDRLFLGLVGEGATLEDLIQIRKHFSDGKRFELAFQRTRLQGRLVWSNEVNKYVRTK